MNCSWYEYCSFRQQNNWLAKTDQIKIYCDTCPLKEIINKEDKK